jgi:organic hydroperoxide reductase OsmC/OhrA
MSEHTATVAWTSAASADDFAHGRYSREHTWTFDGGVTVPASPSPSAVRAPWSNAANVDPEEAYVASIASCHMLTFLWLASKEGVVVTSYRDHAVGVMTRNERGRMWVRKVTLSPEIAYGSAPSADMIEHLHHAAHDECFIASSVKTEIVVR